MVFQLEKSGLQRAFYSLQLLLASLDVIYIIPIPKVHVELNFDKLDERNTFYYAGFEP